MSSLYSKAKTLWENSFIYKGIEKSINKKFRKQLKNDDFSILCSNCIGGCIYHRLGKRFLSPTINMWMTQPDFVTFLLRLDDYLCSPVRFIETEESTPCGKIGGVDSPEILLHFNHAKTQEEAEKHWIERRGRINKENLYIILYNLDGVTEEQLHLLDHYPCRNKVVLTAKELPGVSWSKFIKRPNHGQYPDSYLGRDVFGIRHYEKKWDFVGFLNK